MKRVYRITLIFIIFLITNSCERLENNWTEGKGVLRVVGNYTTFDNKTIIIENFKNGLISFVMKDDKKVLIESKYKFSDYQSWFLIYDNEKRLWFYSGDIGSMFWQKKNNTYKQIEINIDTFKIYRESMPEVLQIELENWF